MFTGKVIAPGIAIGPAAIWAPVVEPVGRRQIPAAQVQRERQRLQHALRRARFELEKIAMRVAIIAGNSAAAIFTAYGLLLDDLKFCGADLSAHRGRAPGRGKCSLYHYRGTCAALSGA